MLKKLFQKVDFPVQSGKIEFA